MTQWEKSMSLYDYMYFVFNYQMSLSCDYINYIYW